MHIASDDFEGMVEGGGGEIIDALPP